VSELALDGVDPDQGGSLFRKQRWRPKYGEPRHFGHAF
jgi:hypothetical protein